jgi:DNA repair protein RecN (Recombination protein N)
MLLSISIKNYAIIEDLTVDFGVGLNVLTGETGAGKSIIIDALGLVLGERSAASVIRKGAQKCEIAAVFDLSGSGWIKKSLAELGVESGDELLFKREITSDGRTRCFINGMPVTVGMLQEAGEALVDIHGQHEHQSLVKPECQRDLLDAYSGLERLRSDVAKAFENYSALKSRLDELKGSERERSQKLDLFKYQLKEIEEAKLEIFDEKRLETEYTRLNNAEKLYSLAAETYSLLYDAEGAAIEKLGSARKMVENLASLDSSMSENLKRLNSVVQETGSLAEEIREYRDSIQADQARLEEIISLTDKVNRLKRKYAPTVKEIIAYAGNIRKQVEFFEKADENISGLEDELEKSGSKLRAVCVELSEKRAASAKKLSSGVEKELLELGMPKAKFFVSVEREKSEAGEFVFKTTGIDRIEYRISANPGEDPKPLKSVASGGEMSRVMLAIKTVLARADRTPTLIFDEIDAGLSGPMGQVVGKKLKGLSKSHRIVCITHLPQLAAFAGTHFHVSKSVKTGKTSANVTALAGADRVDEIARMLGGAGITEISRKHAIELVKESK